jgi:hypothetical protein
MGGEGLELLIVYYFYILLKGWGAGDFPYPCHCPNWSAETHSQTTPPSPRPALSLRRKDSLHSTFTVTYGSLS